MHKKVELDILNSLKVKINWIWRNMDIGYVNVHTKTLNSFQEPVKSVSNRNSHMDIKDYVSERYPVMSKKCFLTFFQDCTSLYLNCYVHVNKLSIYAHTTPCPCTEIFKCIFRRNTAHLTQNAKNFRLSRNYFSLLKIFLKTKFLCSQKHRNWR